jgi:hypothetical protein
MKSTHMAFYLVCNNKCPNGLKKSCIIKNLLYQTKFNFKKVLEITYARRDHLICIIELSPNWGEFNYAYLMVSPSIGNLKDFLKIEFSLIKHSLYDTGLFNPSGH